MIVEINKKGFLQAEALLSDVIFSMESNKSSPENIKRFKLLQARHANRDFEMKLAEFICGDNNSFPYRSSFYLTRFFTDLGFDYAHDGTTRRFWVQEVLLELPIADIAKIIERGLFKKSEFKEKAKKNNLDVEVIYKDAQKEFKELIDESVSSDSPIDLVHILGLNINIELLFNEKIATKDEELNKLIKEAKDRFTSPNDKQIALEKLWDAFERIKTYFDSNKKQSSEKLVNIVADGFDVDSVNNEFKLLTLIGNTYRIRHHESDKKEIKSVKHINYLFFRMLSLIDLCLNSIKEIEEVN